MFLEINKNDEKNKYLMSIVFTCIWDVDKIWKFLATNEGLKEWFPELSVRKDKLLFDMEDYHQEMDIIEYQENKKFSFTWDKAKVKFIILDKGNIREVRFNEDMPYDFPNINNDFGGWLTHMTRLNDIFNDITPKEVMEQVKICEKQIDDYMKTISN